MISQASSIVLAFTADSIAQNGLLLVDGVLASSHSEWLLDNLVPAGLTPHLPAIYQLLFKPLFWLYKIVGAGVMQKFDPEAWGLLVMPSPQLPAYTLGFGLLTAATVAVMSKF